MALRQRKQRQKNEQILFFLHLILLIFIKIQANYLNLKNLFFHIFIVPLPIKLGPIYDITNIYLINPIQNICMLSSSQSKLKAIRINYKNVRKLVMNEELSKVKFDDLNRYKRQADEQLKRMQTLGEFQHLEQVHFYAQKFQAHIDSVKQAFTKKLKWREITPQVQQIYKHENFVKGSTIKKAQQEPSNKSMRMPKKETAVISNFFEEKRSKIVPDVGFKSLLENPPVTNTNFKKRIGNNNEQIRKLKAQNQELKTLISNGDGKMSQEQKQKYEEKFKRFQDKIDRLEDQNRRLFRENQVLKSQNASQIDKNSQVGSNYTRVTIQEQLYAPYFIKTQQNDLHKINARNQSDVGYSNADPFDRQDYMRDFGRDYDAYSEPVYNDNANQSYSIFDTTKSYFPEANQIMSTSKLGLDDPQTIYRNKVAFLKPTGILVRNDDIQIGYKKSALDYSRTRQKIILYFNNKSRSDNRLQVFYDYERDYFDLSVKQKVKSIEGFRQAREVVQVQLQKYQSNLNSIIEVNIAFGNQNYKLWLPVNFIQFQRRASVVNSLAHSKFIRPSKGFTQPQQLKKMIPELQINSSTGQVWGVSRVFEGPIQLNWKSSSKVEIKTSDKWIDYLGFILVDYK